MLTQTTTRVLEPSDLDAALAVLDREPVPNAFVASRVHTAGLDPWRLGGEMWGWYADGMLQSLCYAGANLVPICATPEAVRAFADRARRAGRRCSSIVGPAGPTAQLWRLLEPSWGPAREVRAHQPLMVTDRLPDNVAPDPYVRRIRKDEMETIMPACVAMFTEEVGISPLAGDGGLLYQARVAELVGSGRSFARLDEYGKVVFKAEIGAATPLACQIQGVWVAPEYRGQGLAAPGMAAVLRYALTDVAPVASLYVNDFNTAARAAYRRVGFQEIGAFMSVLF
ncbi:GNAT family N-acetyltransferase [Streptomyces jeddahensis]|uniref:Mycothiol acetyltransferase n=1 Tax=Streptomyces jeddahensis TaxID=1716141 RepID=A0A177HGG9_9ACTN|nr:GNAT family N-acetyltransferase [Streptomyces jeddahensis]OAH10021.1 mycothiol acetyltransferase [Streptomyces jeddahensis]